MGWLLNRTLLRGTYRYRHPIRSGARRAFWDPLWDRKPRRRRTTPRTRPQAAQGISGRTWAALIIYGVAFWAGIAWLVANYPKAFLFAAVIVTGVIVWAELKEEQDDDQG